MIKITEFEDEKVEEGDDDMSSNKLKSKSWTEISEYYSTYLELFRNSSSIHSEYEKNFSVALDLLKTEAKGSQNSPLSCPDSDTSLYAQASALNNKKTIIIGAHILLKSAPHQDHASYTHSIKVEARPGKKVTLFISLRSGIRSFFSKLKDFEFILVSKSD